MHLSAHGYIVEFATFRRYRVNINMGQKIWFSYYFLSEQYPTTRLDVYKCLYSHNEFHVNSTNSVFTCISANAHGQSLESHLYSIRTQEIIRPPTT